MNRVCQLTSAGWLVSMGLVLASCGGGDDGQPAETARPVKTLTLAAPEAKQTFTFPARIEAADRADMSFRRGGTLMEIPVTAGIAVSAGDLLARLDPRDFENSAAEARSAYEAGVSQLELIRAGARREEIALLEASVRSAEAQKRNALTEFERAKRMLDRGLISQSEHDRAATSRDVTAAAAEQASQQLAQARAGARPEEIAAQEAQVEGLKARLEQAEAMVEDTYLRAPFDGVVAAVAVDNYTDVGAQQTVVTLQNIAGFEVKVQIPELIMMERKEGRPPELSVRFPSRGDGVEYPATLKEFKTEPDPVTQTYEATLSMAAPDSFAAVSGMSAEVLARLEDGAREGRGPAMRVPVEAVAGGDQPFVWVVGEDHRISARNVTAGPMVGEWISILDGLGPGDTVVTAGVSFLVDGMLIRPLDS